MKLTSRLLLSFALILGSFGMAQGQSTISYFSSFAKPGQAVPQQCIDAKTILADALSAYPHPDKWTYIIACDENAWHQVMTHIGITESDGKHLGETDFSDDVKLTNCAISTCIAMTKRRWTSSLLIGLASVRQLATQR